MSFSDATKQFDEARDMTDPQADPEKWDLYDGLGSLTRGLIELDSKLDRIIWEIRQLRR